MRPADDIKRLVNKAQITSSSQVDRRILGDALEDLEKRRTDRHTRRPDVWRIVMETRIGKLVLATAAIITLVVVTQQFGGPAVGTGIAWGDVREAFLQQHWVHVKYDNGEERWSNLQTGDSYFKQWDGRCVAVDYARNLRQVYAPYLGRHISEDRPVIYPDGVIPPWEPKTAWESAIGPWEQTTRRGKAEDWEVEKHPDQVSGEQLIRFDCYFNDAAGRRLLIRQIWADPKTRLPLTAWERLQLADREKQKRESITGTFDFPQTGPATIYDLGVPKDLPLAKDHDRVPASSVEKVMEAGQAAWGRFPSRYRAVGWDNTQTSEIEVIWHDGPRVRLDHYFNLLNPAYHLSLPATAAQVLDWARTQVPTSTYLFEGKKSYTRHYAHPGDPQSPNEVRVTRDTDASGLPTAAKPVDEQWFYTKLDPSRFERIENAPEELGKYIGLRTNAGDIRRDYYVDPEHDYICVRNIWWKQRAGQWEKEREYEYSGFTRLPQGPWYAAKQTLTTYADPERGTVQGGANWNLDVQLLEETDFPADTFDGNKLLEGAKLETY
jgi:hypothetical protein